MTGSVTLKGMARTALITGGTGGLGVAVVQRFLEDGWRVVVPWIVESELSRLEPHPALSFVQADLFDEQSVRGVVERAAHSEAAPLGAVVNLVGGFSQAGRVHETPIADFEAQFRLNLRPTYLVCQAAIPRLIAAGGGAIVCVSSRAAVQPSRGAAGYSASKAAVSAFVRALDLEYRDDGIRVNAVMPSIIDTPANRNDMPNADFAKWVKPAEIADVIHHLCSERSTATSGALIPVYGRA